jgi:hypothetical protein
MSHSGNTQWKQELQVGNFHQFLLVALPLRTVTGRDEGCGGSQGSDSKRAKSNELASEPANDPL